MCDHREEATILHKEDELKLKICQLQEISSGKSL